MPQRKCDSTGYCRPEWSDSKSKRHVSKKIIKECENHPNRGTKRHSDYAVFIFQYALPKKRAADTEKDETNQLGYYYRYQRWGTVGIKHYKYQTGN